MTAEQAIAHAEWLARISRREYAVVLLADGSLGVKPRDRLGRLIPLEVIRP